MGYKGQEASFASLFSSCCILINFCFLMIGNTILVNLFYCKERAVYHFAFYTLIEYLKPLICLCLTKFQI